MDLFTAALAQAAALGRLYRSLLAQRRLVGDQCSRAEGQARRLEKAEAMARDAIALFLDVPSDSFDVSIEPVLPRDLQRKVGRARKVRDEAEVYSVKRQTPAPRLQPISFKPLT